MHSSVRPCVDCHRLIDPIGFTFEFFDGVGRARARRTAWPSTRAARCWAACAATDPSRTRAPSSSTSPRAPRCTTASRARSSATPTPPGPASRPRAPSPRCSSASADADLSIDELLVALTRSVHFTERARRAPWRPPTRALRPTRAPDASDARPTRATRPTRAPAPDARRGATTTPGVTTATVRDSTWDTGFCERVAVTNTTAAPLTWTVVPRRGDAQREGLPGRRRGAARG